MDKDWLWQDLWSFNLCVFTVEKDQLKNSRGIRVTKPWTKMVHQDTNSSLHPVKPEQPQEVDFLGDKYAIDEDMPQTVSISASILFRLCVLALQVGRHFQISKFWS